MRRRVRPRGRFGLVAATTLTLALSHANRSTAQSDTPIVDYNDGRGDDLDPGPDVVTVDPESGIEQVDEDAAASAEGEGRESNAEEELDAEAIGEADADAEAEPGDGQDQGAAPRRREPTAASILSYDAAAFDAGTPPAHADFHVDVQSIEDSIGKNPPQQYSEKAREEIKPGRIFLGPELGFAIRTDGDAEIGYQAGLLVGGHVQIVLQRWLFLMPRVAFEWHELTNQPDVKQKDDGAHVGDLQQNDEIELYTLGVSLQPVWEFSPSSRIWAGIGAEWGRTTLDAVYYLEPESGAVVVNERHGVLVEYPVSIGGSYDTIPGYMTVGAQGYWAAATRQSGSLFQTTEGRLPTGQVVTAAPMPVYGSVFAASFMVTLSL